MSLYSEEPLDDLDFEFDDRDTAIAYLSTMPAPPPVEALGDEWFEECDP